VEAQPVRVNQRAVTAKVPSGSGEGRPTLLAPQRQRAFASAPIRIVRPGRLVPRNALRLIHAAAQPRRAFYDGARRVHIHFRLRTRSLSTVTLELVRRSTGRVVARFVRHGVSPFTPHAVTWNGSRAGGGAVPAGAYSLRARRMHGHSDTGARFMMLPFDFPVRGSHGYGGAIQRFGAPRSGGRVHQGQDVFSACGTREVAARGGRVVAAGYDPVLYGYWLVIDGRGTATDYRYAHMIGPTPLRSGAHVKTGATVGHVGRTGNARTVGCMLHFEEWPHGWLRGNPIDPLLDLLRWDGWS
jgi:peptidase M23-like protein